jgi:UDP-GlcNAc:undecaprenyl-phosphate GlcNAc-1-phosphate transferase
MSHGLLAAIVGGLALLFTALITPIVRGAALRGGMVRQVQADRWHKRPTPAIGGVAIFLGFGLAVGVGYFIDPESTRALAVRSERSLLPWTPWEGLVAAATLAFVVGLVDDLVHLRPLPKLLGQLLAAGVLLASGIGVWLTGIYPVDAALSLFWFVGITNALNLLDNMDGLAAGIAAIAGGYLALIFALEGAFGLTVLAVGFTAALVGFLAHNYPPARIFMGDSGSLFLGLFLGGLALAPAPGLSRSLAAVLAAPVLILGVPILDTTLVTIGRILEGRPVSQGGKDHTSHRFIDLGLPEKRTLWMLWGLAATGGLVGVLLRSAERGTALIFGGILVAGLTLVGAYLLQARFRALEADKAEGLSLYRFVMETQARFPLAALLLDAVLISLAYYGAYLIRWDPGELSAQLPYFQRTAFLFVGAKIVGFMLSGIYAARLPSFGLYDALHGVRANILATLLAAGTLFLIERVGLSRGVIAVDLLVCSVMTVGARFSFRLLEGTTRRWSEAGEAVVVLATPEDADLIVRQLGRMAPEPRLRPVAVASPVGPGPRSRLGALPLYRGPDGLGEALRESGAHAVVILHGTEDEALARGALQQHLDSEGSVDVYSVAVTLRRVDRGSSGRS